MEKEYLISYALFGEELVSTMGYIRSSIGSSIVLAANKKESMTNVAEIIKARFGKSCTYQVIAITCLDD